MRLRLVVNGRGQAMNHQPDLRKYLPPPSEQDWQKEDEHHRLISRANVWTFPLALVACVLAAVALVWLARL